MSERTPQAGDWYEKDNCRVRIVGFRLDGVAITETIGGFIGCIEDFSGWKHLPGCDSFEWQEPKVIDVDPGEGWRWLEDHERIHEGDQFFRPKYAEFLPVAGSVGHEAKCLRENGNPIRRRIAPVQPANHTCCTIDASGQHQLKERKKTVTFHEVVVRTPSGRELQWVENRNGMFCTGRTRTEVVE